MLRNIEEEYKCLVEAEQFQKLLCKCNGKFLFLGDKLQVNYYYDTVDNALNRTKTTVRIRQQSSDMRLQIKKHKTVKNIVSVSDEYSRKIDTLPFVMKISPVLDDVHFKGVLVTARKKFSFGRNSCVCFDENIYLGLCDYEVEIEVDENDKEEALKVIEYLGLIQKSPLSKSERFFDRLEAMVDEQCDASIFGADVFNI